MNATPQNRRRMSPVKFDLMNAGGQITTLEVWPSIKNKSGPKFTGVVSPPARSILISRRIRCLVQRLCTLLLSIRLGVPLGNRILSNIFFSPNTLKLRGGMIQFTYYHISCSIKDGKCTRFAIVFVDRI